MANTKKRGNGDGSIYYSDAKKKWVGQVTTGRDANGKLQRRTVYGKTKTEVKEKITNIKNEVMHQTYIAPDRITVAELLQTLIDEDYALNIVNDASYSRKKSTLKRLLASSLASVTVQSANPQQIQDYFKGITHYSNSIIGKDFGLLKRCFSEAVKMNIIIKNPMDAVRKPKSSKQDKKIRALTIDEHRKLVTVLLANRPKYHLQMLLMLYTGMRMGEVNALSVHDVDFCFNVITIRRTITRDTNDRAIIGQTTKTYAGQRKLPLPPQIKEILQAYMEQYVPNALDLLFYDQRKQSPITTSQVNCEFCRIMDKYEIPDKTVDGAVSLHSLRHTYATRCIEAGMPAKVLQTLLGHTDIKTTLNTYCDAFADFQSDSLELVNAYLQGKDLMFG